MTDESSSSSSSSTPRSWKLPDGLEDHVETALLKTAVGVTVGGVMGMLLFRSGKGWRATSIATGVGVALGSTYSRMQQDINQRQQQESK